MKNHLLFKLITLIILPCCFFILPEAMNAQGFLKKLADKTTNKLSDAAAEELSEMAVAKLMSPLRRKRYEMMKAQYKEQNGEDFDDSKYKNPDEAEKALYASMMNFYADVELSDQYEFDYLVEIETKDGKEKQKMDMLFTKSGDLLGFRVKEDKENGLIILDYTNDVMVTLDEEKKEAFAIKGVLSGSQVMTSDPANNDYENMGLSISELGKTKKYAGCDSKGYKVESEEGNGEVYFCNSFPFEWKNMFGTSFNRMNSGNKNNHSFYKDYGMPVYSKFKSKDGEESSWEVKKFNEEKMEITSSDYTLMNNQFN